MPVIDGYKCTHVLRHHAPYNSYVHDVPIIAMTASAIQGDKEKCQKAGMDDYLAKPVKSRVLEQMLVRWSTSRRIEPPSRAASQASNCSEAGDSCANTGIPAVGHDQTFDKTTLEVEGLLEGRRSNSSLLTPRGMTRAGSSESQSRLKDDEMSLEPHEAHYESQDEHNRRHNTDERAKKGRDDKLMYAAGGTGESLQHTQVERGDSLTEANVEKFAREESRRRRKS